MIDLFKKTSSNWVRYDSYELKATDDGQRYVTPAPDSKPLIYDPIESSGELVIDALNVGMLCMGREKDDIIQAAVMEFVSKYGLLGFMTALPTTPQFLDYESAYFPTNHFIKEEFMLSQKYTMMFFPFTKPDLHTVKGETVWNISGDKIMMALAHTFSAMPMAQNLSFQREYAEPYDWLATQFKDWAFTFISSFMYYEDYDKNDETTRDLYRQGMAAFGGIAPTYRIALLDKPTIVWDFNSLLLGIQMMFSFALVDDKKTLRMCKHCQKVFAAGHVNAVFCSPKCKNQYNVYKARAKKKDT